MSLCQLPAFAEPIDSSNLIQVLRRGADPAWPNVFAHFATLELAALSCEPHQGASFAACYFEVPVAEFSALQEREDMYELVAADAVLSSGQRCQGYICCRTTDEKLRSKLGPQVFHVKYGRHFNGTPGEPYPIPRPPQVWSWEGPIFPARIYTRHCVLAIRNQAGEAAENAFLDDTLLWDWTTTLRAYLAANPLIMATPPPPSHPDAYCFNG
eukprot:CAMPEP_0202810966 /NCGR_PEP_ID=MMETSP1389-20130828/2960_1 /ASSEMBLY_ACC=CAM_ASM_000865 /TAXON_ID=302021 /ORGANISM="Rhodomonas sp., Strain CCMP768" /LENGTH=211 /DNA_ID=CAMNT_0049481995 /DNA_START=190 /DNA_END=825 /DNA_ORIENTATION=-